jgi:hypothetical protein
MNAFILELFRQKRGKKQRKPSDFLTKSDGWMVAGEGFEPTTSGL